MTDLSDTVFTRKPIAKGVRFDVLNRDGFKCTYCGAAPPDVVLHIDHKVAVANGGGNDIDNLVTACLPCNIGKGTKTANARGPSWSPPHSERPRIEFFWKHEPEKPHRIARARCVEWLPNAEPYGGPEYRALCNATGMGTHGHSTSGFSPYEAAMYAVDILTQRWVHFSRYVSYIDDLNLMAEQGNLPQYIAPHVLRALHPETIYSRCDDKPGDYEAIADSVAAQSVAAFRKMIDSQHTLWKDAQ